MNDARTDLIYLLNNYWDLPFEEITAMARKYGVDDPMQKPVDHINMESFRGIPIAVLHHGRDE